MADRVADKNHSAGDLNYLYQFRIIVVGEPSVGKSCILYRFTENRFFETIMSTTGFDFHSEIVPVDGHNMKLQLWDTAGQERYRAIARAYYRDVVGVLAVFDISDQDSFTELPSWIDDVREQANPHAPVFIVVGNKCDKANERTVPRREAERFARRYSMDYLECSAKTGANISEAFELLTRKIYDAVKDGRIKMEEGWEGVKSVEEMTNSMKAHNKPDGNSCCSVL